MKLHDYIPGKDSELVAWGDNFVALLAVNAAAWEIPTSELSALKKAQTTFKTLHAQADSPARNSIIVAEKNAARETLETKIRALVDFRLRNPVITNAQLIALGLHVRDTTKTTIPIPGDHPVFNLGIWNNGQVSVAFRSKDSLSKAKPYGINGAVIIYAVLDSPPASQNALNRNVLATRTPHILEFAEEERGKTVYVAICWQNEKGQKGPWSEIESAIIP